MAALVAVAVDVVASVQSVCSIALLWSRQYLPPLLDIWVDLLRKAGSLLHSVRSMSAYGSGQATTRLCRSSNAQEYTPNDARWISGSFPKMLLNDTRLRRCGFTPVLLRSNTPVL